MTDGPNAPSDGSSGPPSRPDRARRLLQQYIEERGASLQQIARELGTPVEEVTRRLQDGDPVSLEWVEQVLRALEVAPGEFFGRLYSDEPAGRDEPAEATPLGPETEDEVLTRDEVEGLVTEARSLVRGAMRMIEARERVDRETGADDD